MAAAVVHLALNAQGLSRPYQPFAQLGPIWNVARGQAQSVQLMLAGH